MTIWSVLETIEQGWPSGSGVNAVLITLSWQYDSFDDFINELLGRLGVLASTGPNRSQSYTYRTPLGL